MNVEKQPEVNIGMVGHVDHGKSTLTKALTGERTDRHSEEIKRGISIRLGYADMNVYRCEHCQEPDNYGTARVCKHCGKPTKFVRAVSFVDAPGHETLMATMLSGAAIMDGAVLVIAANEKCPQPQTKEHLIAIQIVGVKKIIIAQNKIDVVTPEQAKKNHDEIREFIKGTVAESAPIIPVSAHHDANIDALIMTIEDLITTPEHDMTRPSRMYVARSFDVNKPGTVPQDLKGGVLGGSLIQGEIKIGDEIEIAPGRASEVQKGRYESYVGEVTTLFSGAVGFDKVRPGGLIAIGTNFDPALTKSDALAGKILGKPGTLPQTIERIRMDTVLLERTVGTQEELEVVKIRTSEAPMFTLGTMTTVGDVTSTRGDYIEAKLKIPVCAEAGQRVAISRRISGKWRLIGHGILK
jgi:translation initiation factor 2 subunit 3